MTEAPRPGIRRRLDRLALRLQARLDSAWADRVVPWAVAAGLFTLLVALDLAGVRQLDGGPNLAMWRQAAWNVEQGGPAYSSLADLDVVSDTWSFVSWPLLWLSRGRPVEVVLAVAEAAGLALAVVPIWRVARESARLRVGTTFAVVVAYALAPTVLATTVSGFHPETLAVGALAWAVELGRRERWVGYAVAIAFALACRGDIGFTVAAFGVLGITNGNRRVGITTVAVGLAWSGAALAVLDPQVPTDTLRGGAAVAAGMTTPLAMARELVIDPLQVLADVASQVTLTRLITLLAPLLFLPVTAPRFLVPAVPAVVFGTATQSALLEVLEPGGSATWAGGAPLLLAVVGVFFAALAALGRIGRPSVSRVLVDHRIVGAMVVASVMLFAQAAPASPYEQPWGWGFRDRVDAARLAAADLVPELVPVAASPQIAALVAERDELIDLSVAPVEMDRWRAPADVLLFDTNGEDSNGLPVWDDDQRDDLRRDLRRRGFLIVYDQDGILLAERPPS